MPCRHCQQSHDVARQPRLWVDGPVMTESVDRRGFVPLRAVARNGILFGPILDPVPGRGCSARIGQAALLIVLLVVSGCVRQAAPAPPVQRTTPPPWDAPRDAVSYINAAGLEAQPLNSNGKSHVIDLRITFDGAPVEVPAYVGIDRIRALQAPVHTHDSSGRVWVEGRETDAVTLAQFFMVWGVRFDGRCLGSACGRLVVKVDRTVTTDPREVRLAASHRIDIAATSS
jgi:hypothetical protein